VAATSADLTHALWAQGVTTYLPTVITASEEKITHVLAVIAAARRSDPLLAHSIAGIHVEGPSLAADDGPRGAHDARRLRAPDIAELARWPRARVAVPPRPGRRWAPAWAMARAPGCRAAPAVCGASAPRIA